MKYVCELCGTIYNEEIGDVAHGIPAGTSFDELSEYYECPGCGSGKEALNPVQPNVTVQPMSNFDTYQKYTDNKPESER